MTHKTGLLIILPFILASCGGSSSSSPGASAPTPTNTQTAQYITYYRPASTDSSWFDATWKSQKLDKVTNGYAAASLSFPDTSPSPSEALASKKGVFLGKFDGAPMKLTIERATPYNMAIDYMVLSDKDNVLTLKGDKTSSFKVNDFSLSGKIVNEGVDFAISRGNMKDGSEIEGEFKFEKFPASLLDNTFTMEGGTIAAHDSSLTIPQGFILKGNGIIHRQVINKGTIDITTGKPMYIDNLNNSSGSIILHITKDKGIALSSSSKTPIKNLKITVHSDVGLGRHEIFEIQDSGVITPTFTNDAQGNITYEVDKYVLNLTKKPTIVFFIARNIHSPAYQRSGLFETPDAVMFLSPHLRLTATQDTVHDGAFIDFNFIKNNTSFGAYGYHSLYNQDAGLKIGSKHGILHHTSIFHVGHDQNIKDAQSQFCALKTSLELPIQTAGIQIKPAIHFAYETILNAHTSKNTPLNFDKSGIFSSGVSLCATSKSGGFLQVNYNHGGISQGLFLQTGINIKI